MTKNLPSLGTWFQILKIPYLMPNFTYILSL